MIVDAILNGLVWIIEVIVNGFVAVVSGLLDLAPDIAIPDLSSQLAAGSGVWEYVGWANNFVPVDQLALIIGLVVTWYVVLHAVRLTVYLLSKAHILGGSSE